MKKNYNYCLNEVLKSEGGYTNDPSDSGGPTNYGITISDVRKYVNSDATAQDVRNLTLDQAKSIYKSKYWDTLGCDGLASGVDYTCFDYGVNSGLNRPRSALKKFSSLSGVELINAINDERLTFLQNLAIQRPKDQKFLRGWTNRVSRVRADSLNLAKSLATPASAGAGGAIVAGGAAIAVTPHQYWPWIAGGIVIICVIAGVIYLVHKYRSKAA